MVFIFNEKAELIEKYELGFDIRILENGQLKLILKNHSSKLCFGGSFLW